MASYSLANLVVGFSGPGIAVDLSSGVGYADGEILTISFKNSRNNQMVGADGTFTNSLNQDESATLEIRLQRASPANGALSEAFNLQSLSAGASWGQNAVSIRDVMRDESMLCEGVCFTKMPDISYSANAGVYVWTFDVGRARGRLSREPM